MKKEFFADYCMIAITAVGSVVVFVLFVIWGVNLPQTALLWINGLFAGWFQLIIYGIIFSLFCFFPAFICLEDIEFKKWGMKRNAKRNTK